MAKIQGPLFSVSAAGSIASALTFRRTARGQIAQMPPIPQAAASAHQLAERQRMRDAASSWNALDATAKAPWVAIGLATGRAPWLAYWREWQFQYASPGTTLLIPEFD